MKKTAHKKDLILIVTFLLVAITLSLYYVFYRSEKGSVSNVYTTEYDLIDGKEIVMLCFFSTETDSSLSVKCLNRNTNFFDDYTLEINKFDLTGLEIESIKRDTSLKAILLDTQSQKLTIYDNSTPYEKGLMSMLKKQEIDNYVIGKTKEENIPYIDLYDYLHTRIAFIKYCESDHDLCDENYLDETVKSLKTTLTFYCSAEENCSKNFFLYPADYQDIKYLKEIDKGLGESVESESVILLDLLYQNISYFLDRGDFDSENLGVSANILENFNDLYKIKRFISEARFFEEEYLQKFEEYEKALVRNAGIAPDMGNLLGEYLPESNIEILFYFNDLYENESKERFTNELKTLFYYMYLDEEDIDDDYKIINTLFDATQRGF